MVFIADGAGNDWGGGLFHRKYVAGGIQIRKFPVLVFGRGGAKAHVMEICIWP